MTQTYDLVLRGGTVVDGSGSAPFVADVAVKDGFIVAVGVVPGTAARSIDAAGLLVTPGFVDIHTHYDGQATWSDRVAPSSDHGVTTVVMGNCGVGFAPCRKEDHGKLVDVMEGVEDIPEVVMTKGLDWSWETFPEYLNTLDTRPHDIDIAAYLPHSPLRVYVMGDRGVNREPATSDDLAQMKTLAREAIKAGALGFSTSRFLFHRTGHGQNIPSYEADWNELRSIGEGMEEAGSGVFQIARDRTDDLPTLFGKLQELGTATRQPLIVSELQMHSAPKEWRQVTELVEQSNARGARMFQQTFPRSVSMIVGLTTSNNPFRLCPSYAPLVNLPIDEKLARLRQPELRTRLINEAPSDKNNPIYLMSRDFERMFPLGDPPNYEPSAEDSVAARARREGRHPEDVVYDLLLEDDGRSLLYVTVANYFDFNLDFLETLLAHRDTIIGLGDGGAHYGFICDSSYTTFALTHWVRDRKGKHFSLAEVVRMLSRGTAAAVGLEDRGLVAPGYKADLNVIDHDRLKLHAPYVVHDLPGGGQRLHQRADGYVATIVSGEIIAEHGVPNASRPGRLVRGRQSPRGAA